MTTKTALPKEGKDVVEQLRDAIRESGQTLTQLAKLAGLDSGRLSRFMRGERDLTFGGASKLCSALRLVLRRETPEAPSVAEPSPTKTKKGKRGGASAK